MLAQALKYLVEQINEGRSEDLVAMGNIARMEQTSANGPDLQRNVIATIVNIEEEKTLKNGSPYVRVAEDQINRRNPTLFLNMYVLFSSGSDDYEMALRRISMVVGFFQANTLFTAAGAVADFPTNVERMAVDLFSPSFEQVNHLWGVLGGKYLPSALYRVRMVAIQAAPFSDQDVIRTIRTDEAPMPERAAG